MLSIAIFDKYNVLLSMSVRCFRRQISGEEQRVGGPDTQRVQYIISTACGPSEASRSPEWVQPFSIIETGNLCSIPAASVFVVMFSCLTFLA